MYILLQQHRKLLQERNKIIEIIIFLLPHIITMCGSLILYKMNIIAATEKDITIIQRLALEIWPVVYKDIITQEQIRYMLDTRYSVTSLEQQMQAGQQFFLAEEEHVYQGFAGVAPTDEAGVYKLEKLYVHPSHHRSGIGQLLLAVAENYTVNKGANTILLQVNRLNNAVEFYRKMGFIIDKEMDVDIGGGFYMNDYFMRKTLDK